MTRDPQLERIDEPLHPPVSDLPRAITARSAATVIFGIAALVVALLIAYWLL
jgi:hypothetical protein